jgi:hypothetical protein
VCAREDGIRRSKDLRAEIGKFPNSTNERKKMSKKTIKQRIALVAALALGTGVLSVAPAYAGDVEGTTQVNFKSTAAGSNDPTRACSVIPDTAGGTDYNTAYALKSSAGVLLQYVAAASGDTSNIQIKISGPGVISAASAAVVVSATEVTDSAMADTETVTIKPTGDGVITIKVYDYDTTTSPILRETLTLNIVASCANSTFSSADSRMAIIEEDAADARLSVADGSWIDATEILAASASGPRLTSNVDTTGASVVTNGESGYIGLGLVDAYGGALTADALVATVTSGDAFVRITDDAVGTAVPAAGLAKTSVLSSTGRNAVVRVTQSVENKPTTAIVQISFAGNVVGTKSFTFQGVAASIEIKDVTVGTTSSVGFFRAKVLDAAGNALYSKTVENDSTANSATAIATITSGVTQSAVTAADGDWSPEAGAGSDGRFGCTLGGVTTLNVKHVVDAATSVKKSFAIACGGALDTWTISMDKASYQPGEIATLTVTGKDSKGNLVNSALDISTVEYSFGGMTFVTAPTTTDSFTSAAGAKTYKLSVGTTEGSFVGSFKITGSTDTAAKTVQYKVAAGTATVSNADVLKSIVALIASINKQIQALQKLILKR